MKRIKSAPTASAVATVFDNLTDYREAVAAVSGPTVGGRYVHYDRLRRLPPPEGLTHDQWWCGLKHFREATRINCGLQSTRHSAIGFTVPNVMLEMLHRIDRQLGHSGVVNSLGIAPELRDLHLFEALAEEATTSSQIEGASTNRWVAAEMLRSGRAARDHSERMIYNNYQAMRQIHKHAAEPLTPDLVCSIHRTTTAATLGHPSWSGRPRQGPFNPGFGVYDIATGELLHQPPPPSELPARLEAMCTFANGQGTHEFVHPVVRAVMLHYWLAYDHPFEDGNGRTARALFYWSMLHQGYDLCAHISISSLIARAKSKYVRSFRYSETDGDDATYFVLHQLDIVIRAIDDIATQMKEKSQKSIAARERLVGILGVNERQEELLDRALSDKRHRFTAKSHQEVHGVVRATALADLWQLAELGLLVPERRGKTIVFSVAEDIEDRIQKAKGSQQSKR